MIHVSHIEWEAQAPHLPTEITLQLETESKDDSAIAEMIFDQLFMSYGKEVKTFTFSEVH